jgi:hypothetical protein
VLFINHCLVLERESNTRHYFTHHHCLLGGVARMDDGSQPGPSQSRAQETEMEPAPAKPAIKNPRKSFKSFAEVQREQQEKRRNRTTPPPWIARKLAVFIVIGLIIFATYVYVARACLPLIRGQSDVRGGGRKVGGKQAF